MDWTQINETVTSLSAPPHIYYAIGVTLTLTLFLIFLFRRQPKNITAYRTENGRVMIRRSAIVELVQTSCKQLNDVAKPNVKVRVKGKYTHFDVRIQLMSGGHLKDIERTLQAHLRQGLTEHLGIKHVGKINIIATGFKSGAIRMHSSLSNKEDAPSIAPDSSKESKQSAVEIQDTPDKKSI